MQKETNLPAEEHETRSSLSSVAPGEIIIGTVTDIDRQGLPLINYYGNPLDRALIAVSTLAITQKHIGRQVALLFANGDPQQPVIMGVIHSPLQELLENYEADAELAVAEPVEVQTQPGVENVTVDGKRVVLEGKEEIILKCGAASITLTKAGKILIRGKYLLNRSSGVNRIMGGSVQVN